MTQKTEKLEQQIIDTLVLSQNKISDLVVNLGQIHLKQRDLNEELKKIEEIKLSVEDAYDSVNSELNELLRDLEIKYPKGEIDLNEGIVIYESAE